MASLKRLFGVSKGNVTQDSASEALQTAETQLIKKQNFLEKKIEECVAQAKQYGLKNKKSALECLKRKCFLEKQLELVDGALMNLQCQRNALDNAMMNKNILDTMKTVNVAIKAIHKNENADKVHDLMDDVNEQREIANEIAMAISMPTGCDQYDIDELDRELKMLMEEDVDERLLSPHDVDELPSVPAHALTAKSKPSKKAEEDSTLADLNMWAT